MKNSSVFKYFCNYKSTELNSKRNNGILLNYFEDSEDVSKIRLNLPDFVRSIYHLDDRILDLLEIATYIYSADRLSNRGSRDSVEYHAWARSFDFSIKVRDYNFWNTSEIKKALNDLLCFMSGDFKYNFDFHSGHETPPTSLFDHEKFILPDNGPTSILLFSGGLDSLAGAIDRLTTTEDNICLISHRSQPRIKRTQDQIVSYLQSYFPNRICHYKFDCNFSGVNTIEETQRTRSLLYSSIAFAITTAYNSNEIFVYENGITGINFNKRKDMGNARASRTTHPKTLKLLENFFNLFTEQKVKINNPFVFKTKADIITSIDHNGHSNVISSSVSCGKGKLNFTDGTHCGVCSQCIDRRLSIYAAKLDIKDDEDAIYSFDIISNTITVDEYKITLLDYIRQAYQFKNYSYDNLYYERASELSDLIGNIENLDEDDIISQIMSLLNRHGTQIEKSLKNIFHKHGNPFSKVSKDSLIDYINNKTYLSSSLSYSDLIRELYGIESGLKDAKKYEKYMEKVLPILFAPNLTDVHSQVITDDERECIDITFQNSATSGFWKDIKDRYGNMIIIFELKNMSNISNTEINQISSRLNNKKGMLGFMVCRNYDDKDIDRVYRKLSNNDQVILLLCDSDIELMLKMLENSQKPTEFIFNIYRRFIEKL